MKNRFIVYLIVLTIWVPIVMAIFHLVSEKKFAGLIAGFGFLILPMGILINEALSNKPVLNLWWLAHAQFIFVFSIPILILRAINWGAEFNSIEIMGFRAGYFLHQCSNVSYGLMLIANLLSVIWLKKRTNQTKKGA